MISLVVAISDDEERTMGVHGMLPWYLPADLRRFKSITMGKTIVMGRKTFESIGRALPGRTNVVISTTLKAQPGIEIFSKVSEALVTHPDAMIIGGASLIAETWGMISKCYVTKVLDYKGPTGLAFPPSVKFDNFKILSQEFHPKDDANAHAMEFLVYGK